MFFRIKHGLFSFLSRRGLSPANLRDGFSCRSLQWRRGFPIFIPCPAVYSFPPLAKGWFVTFLDFYCSAFFAQVSGLAGGSGRRDGDIGISHKPGKIALELFEKFRREPRQAFEGRLPANDWIFFPIKRDVQVNCLSANIDPFSLCKRGLE